MSAPTKKSHHIRCEVCATRPRYREGREPKAVKVYTINQESRFLLVQGVPALGTERDLLQLFASYGSVKEHKVLHEYPSEEFTEVYLVAFEKIQSARIAKKKLDDSSFYGGVLHICYAPEHETVDDTRQKLQDRRKAIARRIRELAAENTGAKKTHESNESTQATHDDSNMLGNLSGEPKEHYQEISASGATTIPVQNEARTQEQRVTFLGPSSSAHFLPPRLPPPPRPVPPWHYQPPRQHIGHTPPNILIGPCQTQLPSSPKLLSETITSSSARTNKSQHHTQAAAVTTSRDSVKYTGNLVPRNIQKIVKTPSQTDLKSPNGNSNAPLIVKDYKPKGPTPSLIPRQVTKKVNLLDKTTSKTDFRQTIKDRVNESLRQNAFILDKVKGPKLPENQERKRKFFQGSETGSSSLDETLGNIRKQMKPFSTWLPTDKETS